MTARDGTGLVIVNGCNNTSISVVSITEELNVRVEQINDSDCLIKNAYMQFSDSQKIIIKLVTKTFPDVFKQPLQKCHRGIQYSSHHVDFVQLS